MFGLSLIAALGHRVPRRPHAGRRDRVGHRAGGAGPAGPPVRRAARQVAGAGGLRQRLRRRSPGWPSASSSGSTVGYWPPQPVDRPRAARGADDRAAHPRPAAVHRHLADGVGRRRGRPVRRHLDRRRGRRRSASRSATRASPGSAPCRGCCCRPTACGAGPCTRFQDPIALAQFGGPALEGGFPFLSPSALTLAYLGWAVVWVALLLGLAALTFQRRDL